MFNVDKYEIFFSKMYAIITNIVEWLPCIKETVYFTHTFN